MARQHIIPTDKEIVMRDDDFIVSKTDLKGRITYANRIFMEFSGFEEADLIGKQHNVIRHPDMPRLIFKMLWSEVEAGREIFAYVKNICADGSYYWVLANVTPSLDEAGKVVGYYSVRRKPNPKSIRSVIDLYKRLLQIEADAGTKEAIAASSRYMNNLLSEKESSYEEFILQLQSA
jgi:PAS domain S-box-containing protein